MRLSDLAGRDRNCAHCCGERRGYGMVRSERVCHPDDGIDCYRLVTVYAHPMPCAACAGQRAVADGPAAALADQSGLYERTDTPT